LIGRPLGTYSAAEETLRIRNYSGPDGGPGLTVEELAYTVEHGVVALATGRAAAADGAEDPRNLWCAP